MERESFAAIAAEMIALLDRLQSLIPDYQPHRPRNADNGFPQRFSTSGRHRPRRRARSQKPRS